MLFSLSDCKIGEQVWLWVQRHIQRGHEEKVCPYYAFCGWISQRCGQSAWSLWRQREEWIDPWGEMIFGSINGSHMCNFPSMCTEHHKYSEILWHCFLLYYSANTTIESTVRKIQPYQGCQYQNKGPLQAFFFFFLVIQIYSYIVASVVFLLNWNHADSQCSPILHFF